VTVWKKLKRIIIKSKMEKNIAIIGMPGSGKTTIGRKLSENLSGYVFVDTDFEIEKDSGMTIEDIFKNKGEEYFRNLENKKIKELCQNKNRIISLGGGAFEINENKQILLDNSIVIYLKTDVDSIYNRIKDEKHRPMLDVNSMKQNLSDILAIRKDNYEKAHYTIDTTDKSPYNIVKEILGALNE